MFLTWRSLVFYISSVTLLYIFFLLEKPDYAQSKLANAMGLRKVVERIFVFWHQSWLLLKSNTLEALTFYN